MLSRILSTIFYFTDEISIFVYFRVSGKTRKTLHERLLRSLQYITFQEVNIEARACTYFIIVIGCYRGLY